MCIIKKLVANTPTWPHIAERERERVWVRDKRKRLKKSLAASNWTETVCVPVCVSVLFLRGFLGEKIKASVETIPPLGVLD